MSDRVRDLGAELFGTRRHWHKRIVRSGPNTLQPYRENPPDRSIGADDIVFLDFGPIFAEWEADFGRTYVLGDDPVKHRLRADLPRIWAAGRAHFEANRRSPGSSSTRTWSGWPRRPAGSSAGRTAGTWSASSRTRRSTASASRATSRPGNPHPMRRTDRVGRRCHWILEVHLVDRERRIGGFFEQLLTLRAAAVE